MLKGYHKPLLIKSKIISLYKCLLNNFFLVAFGLLIFVMMLDSWLLLFVLLLYLGYLYRKSSQIFGVALCVMGLFFISFIVNNQILKPKNLSIVEGIVVSVVKEEDYQKITIIKGFRKSIIYDGEMTEIDISDRVVASGTSKEITTNRIKYGFNPEKYYYGIRVDQILSVKTIEVSKSYNLYTMRKIAHNYVNFFFENESRAYMKALALGDNSELYGDDIENIKINGIAHLFAISGLHISLLIGFITKILRSIHISDKKVEKINIVMLILYVIITNFLVSVLRAAFLYIFGCINKKYQLKLATIDILSIIFVVFLMINPSYIYNLSFQLSFLASAFIILFTQVLQVLEEQYQVNSLMQTLIITLCIQVVTFPILINLNNNFNLFSLVGNLVFIFLVSYIVLPATYIVLVIPILNDVYNFIVTAFSWLNNFISTQLTINISFPSFNRYELIIYYSFLVAIVSTIKYRNSKKIILYCLYGLFLFSYYQKVNLNISGEVEFLDVYEGDATVINLPFNQGIIVIDTGTGKNEAVTKYLKAIGVREIDALVLTHNHSDHNGEAKVIINNFKVHKIVISAYDNIDINSAIRVQEGDVVYVNKTQLLFLSPSMASSDVNDNSLVIYTKLGNYNYLFLGDVTKKIEVQLIKYNLNVDVVKVSHHGSKTSTSQVFYQSISPKYVIIETGQTKRYGFPHDEVIDVLNPYKIYRTDINHSICIKYNKKKSIISSIN